MAPKPCVRSPLNASQCRTHDAFWSEWPPSPECDAVAKARRILEGA